VKIVHEDPYLESCLHDKLSELQDQITRVVSYVQDRSGQMEQRVDNIEIRVNQLELSQTTIGLLRHLCSTKFTLVLWYNGYLVKWTSHSVTSCEQV